MICNTPAELRAACAVWLHHSDNRLAELLAMPSRVDALLSIPSDDAMLVIAGLLPRDRLLEWTAARARRANNHAAAAAHDASVAYADAAVAYADCANHAAYHAVDRAAAAYAAAAAAYAAAYAAAVTDRAAEYLMAIRHGAELLGCDAALPECIDYDRVPLEVAS